MDVNKSKFNPVLRSGDVLVVAFGAMIGWGWVVSSGQWIQEGGIIGTILGFLIGGVMIYFVGLCYAELTTAMPKCGGEHVFSFKAFGPIGSYICTWAIILSYIGVVCYEAVSFPTILLTTTRRLKTHRTLQLTIKRPALLVPSTARASWSERLPNLSLSRLTGLTP